MSVSRGPSLISRSSDSSPRAIARRFQRIEATLSAMGSPGIPFVGDNFQVPSETFSPVASVRFTLLSPFHGSPSRAIADPVDTTFTTLGEASITVYDPANSTAATRAAVGDKGLAVLEKDADGELRWVLLEMLPTAPRYGHECRDDTGGTSITGVAATVTLDTEEHQEGDVFELDATNYKVTVSGSGYVEFTGSVSVACSAMTTPPVVVAAYLCENGVEITGTRRWASFTNVNDKFTIPLAAVVNVDNEDYYSIKVIAESGTGTVATAADGSHLISRAAWPGRFLPSNAWTGLACVYDFDDTSDIGGSETGAPGLYRGSPNNNTTAGRPDGTGDFLEVSEVVNEWGYYRALGYKDGAPYMSCLTEDGDWVTVLCWIRPEEQVPIFVKTRFETKGGGYDDWFIGGVGAPGQAFQFGVYNPNRTGFMGSGTVVSSAGNYSANTWYFIAGKARLHNTGGWKLDVYISEDGAAWDSSLNHALTTVSPQTISADKMLINVNGDNPITGTTSGYKDYGLCWMRVYHRQLSDTEIAYHYNGGNGRTYPFV